MALLDLQGMHAPTAVGPQPLSSASFGCNISGTSDVSIFCVC